MGLSITETHEPVLDVILRNCLIVDGSGAPGFSGDIGVREDRISHVGDLSKARAVRTIDVSGLVAAPGFIDVHTHDDAALIARPGMLPKLTQGVTTVVGGNCGISAAPYDGVGDPPDLLRLVFKSDTFMAPNLGEYLTKVAEASPAVNAAFLTGHTTLRMQAMGSDLGRCASAREILSMQRSLARCLEAGSYGFSTGLFYPPARSASMSEIVEIAQPLREYGGIYASHIRDEADRVLEAVEEALAIGRAADSPVIISHHKCMGRKNFGRSVQTLELLRRAREHQDVSLDVYPYTASSTVLNEEQASLSLRTVVTWCDPYPQYCGRDLEEIAREWNCSPQEAIPRLLPAGAVYFTMDEADVTRIIQATHAMIGSDGLPDDQHPHPRLWGTFPRVLGRYVRERKVLTLENAVHRMSGLPATRFGLRDRGHIRVGSFADLCVFDPHKVLDTATYENPMSAASGVCYVFVNGKIGLEMTRPTGIRAGRVLRLERGRQQGAQA